MGRTKYDVNVDLRERRKNDLPQGIVKLIRTLNHRVPEHLPEAAKIIANRALERTVAVMEGKVSKHQSPSVIKACQMVRDEICGPIPKPMEVKSQVTFVGLIAGMEQAMRMPELPEPSEGEE